MTARCHFLLFLWFIILTI